MAGEHETLVLGRRVRYFRRQAGFTLAELGERIGRPAPYLSQLENGKVEPKLSLVTELARALGVSSTELLQPEPPDERSRLEIELERQQQRLAYERLGLPPVRLSKIPDEALAHLVALARHLPDAAAPAAEATATRAGELARQANTALRAEMRERNNYFPEIEQLASKVLSAVGYSGYGPVSERLLHDIVRYFGFSVERVHGMPRSARSITDQREKVIYIPARDDLRVRQARSVLLQTLGHFALEHATTVDFGDYLRQRIESNYFAAAVLAPEMPVVDMLAQAKANGDVSIEDLKETFYISYEMAAHRFTNLATSHLDLPVHFLRNDAEGVITKAYENDGVPFPTAPDGALEGERVSRLWGARQAWNSTDFLVHYQFTLTDVGEYWCVTYIETVTDRVPHAITIGSTADNARHFRGGDTIRRVDARSEVTRPDPDMIARWEGVAWPSAVERSYVLTALPAGDRPFSPFPGVDLIDVYRFLDRQTGRS